MTMWIINLYDVVIQKILFSQAERLASACGKINTLLNYFLEKMKSKNVTVDPTQVNGFPAIIHTV